MDYVCVLFVGERYTIVMKTERAKVKTECLVKPFSLFCHSKICLFVCLFVFVALRPKSTAMVVAGRSVHLTTRFPGQA